LPEPTSPCSSLFICTGARMSAEISSKARRCEPVSSKGSALLNRSASSPAPVWLTPRAWLWRRFLVTARPTCMVNSSSNASR
jgi:hypothetical protein